jgi:hypothetical protein
MVHFCKQTLIAACVLMLEVLVPLKAQLPSSALEAFTPNMSAKIGDTIFVPVSVRRISPAAQQLIMDSCRFIFRFNPTILIPLETRLFETLYLANNLMEGSITVPINKRLRENEAIVQIKMLVCLGDMDSTELSIDRDGVRGVPFQVFAAGMPGVTVQATSGRLYVEDARWNGILRTVNTNVGQLTMNISPNPISQNGGLVELGIGSLPIPPQLGVPSLVLYHTDGRDVSLLGLTDVVQMGFVGKSSLQIRFPRGNLPRGTYYARFTYGPYSITRLVVFE